MVVALTAIRRMEGSADRSAPARSNASAMARESIEPAPRRINSLATEEIPQRFSGSCADPAGNDQHTETERAPSTRSHASGIPQASVDTPLVMVEDSPDEM